MTRPAAGLTDLQSTVDEAIARYVRANPASARRHREAERVLPGGNTRSVLHFDPFPLAFARGEGPYLWSLDGTATPTYSASSRPASTATRIR